MKKYVFLLVVIFITIPSVNAQNITESIPVFMEKVMAKTSKAEVITLLKARKFEIKSKDYIQSTQFMSDEQADKCVMGVGNYGITCMKEFNGYGSVYMKANYTTFEGIRQEMAKSGYKWVTMSDDGRGTYSKEAADGYRYVIWVLPVQAQDGTVWGKFEMGREKN